MYNMYRLSKCSFVFIVLTGVTFAANVVDTQPLFTVEYTGICCILPILSHKL